MKTLTAHKEHGGYSLGELKKRQRLVKKLSRVAKKVVYDRVMNNRDIGALWSKTSKAGRDYMTGTIEINGVRHELVLFKNDRKTKDNQPDWQIFPREPRPELNENGTEKIINKEEGETLNVPF